MNRGGIHVRSAALAAIALLVACGGGGGSRKPDTGIGAGGVPPTTINCNDFCQRAAQCAADLCDEDSMSTRYEGLAGALVGACQAQCTDALLASHLSESEWQCIFQSSCRMAFDSSYDACHGMSWYSCN